MTQPPDLDNHMGDGKTPLHPCFCLPKPAATIHQTRHPYDIAPHDQDKC